MNIASLIKFLSAISWLVLIALVVLIVIRASRAKPLRNAGMYVIILAVIAILFSTAGAGLVFINPNERGVVISAVAPKGYRETALEPGLRWVIPFAENVVLYPISRQTYTMSIAPSEGKVEGDDSIAARTADGQEIYVDASVIYSIDPAKVVQIHILWRDRYTDDLVRPQARGIIRDAVSQYGVQEVYSSKRFELVKDMTEAMRVKLEENGLIMVDFVLRNITFSQEYAASVEQKQIAEQQSQQARFVVESRKQEAEQARQVAQGAADAAVIRSKGEAEARIIQAQAEAKSLELLAEALKNRPELLSYQYIDKISPNIQVMLLPSNAPFVYPLPNLSSTTSGFTSPTPEPTPLP